MNTIFYLIIILIITSCSTEKGNNWDDLTSKLETIKVKKLESVYYPRDICIKDSIIIIKDYGSDSIFTIFSMTSKDINRIKAFGVKGDGPNEYIYPSPIRINKNEFCFYDRSLSRHHIIKSDQKGNLIYKSKTINTSGFNNLIRINENKFIGDGFFPNSRFNLLKNNISTNIYEKYPDDNIVCNYTQKSLAYQGNLTKQPNGNRVVYTSSHGNILEIYKIQNDKIELLYQEYNNFPSYTPYNYTSKEVSANYDEKDKTGAISTYCTDKYIYVLHSGRSKAEYSQEKNYSNIVYIYDWNGMHIHKYILDKDLSCIAIDKNDKYILGIYYNIKKEDDIGIVKYKISL